MENDKNLQPAFLLDDELDMVSGGAINNSLTTKFQNGQLVMSIKPGYALVCSGRGCSAEVVGRVKEAHASFGSIYYHIVCVNCGGAMYNTNGKITLSTKFTKLPDGTYIVAESELTAIG